MKRALYVLFFACLVAENDNAFGRHWVTPLRQLAIFLYEDKPLFAPTIDLLLLALFFGARRAPEEKNPMVRAAYASLAGLALSAVWGVLRGGSLYQAQFQIHPMIVGLLMMAATRRILRTPDEYLGLVKVMIAAALYRALVCVAFYLFVLRDNVLNPPPEFITSHDDTVLFVVGLMALATHALIMPERGRTRRALLGAAMILVAIQLNNRRLAWVSLVFALIANYAALRDPGLRRQVLRYSMRLVPLLALYVAVGWGRPEGIFRPLRALSSVAPGTEDLSSRSRDAENLGLLVTLLPNPALGTGWGHEYFEADSTLSAREFLQYRYLPHNSVLALLAFTGFVGFACVWMTLPVCAFLATRTCASARDPAVHFLAVVTLTEVVVSLIQMWGDMGMIAHSPLFIMAAGYACASRLSEFEQASFAAEHAALDPAPQTAPSQAE